MSGGTGGGLTGGRLAAFLGTFRLLVRKDTPWQARLALIAAIIYLISPYDLVPDWLLGPGIIDDVAVVSLLIWLARRLAGSPGDTDNDISRKDHS